MDARAAKEFPLPKRRVPRLLLACLCLANALAMVAGPVQSLLDKPNCSVVYWAYFLYFPLLTGPTLIRSSVLHNQFAWSRKVRSMALEELDLEQLKTLTQLRDRTSLRWSALVFVVLLVTTSALAGLLFHFQGSKRMQYVQCRCVLSDADVIGSGAYGLVAAIALSFRSHQLRNERDQFGVIAEMRNVGILWGIMFTAWVCGELLSTTNDGYVAWSYCLLATALIHHTITVVLPTITTHRGKLARRLRKVLLFFMLCRDPLFFNIKDVGLDDLEEQYKASADDMRKTIEEMPLERLLEIPSALTKFEEFLIGEFSVENIRFWVGVRRWKAEYTSMGIRSTQMMAKALYSNFVAADAVMQVNISDALRRGIEEKILTIKRAATRKLPLCTFDAAEAEILNVMRRDSYPRFKRSDLHDALVLHLLYSSGLLRPLAGVNEADDLDDLESGSSRNVAGRPLSMKDLASKSKRLSGRDLMRRSRSTESSGSKGSKHKSLPSSISSALTAYRKHSIGKRPRPPKKAYSHFVGGAAKEVELRANPMVEALSILFLQSWRLAAVVNLRAASTRSACTTKQKRKSRRLDAWRAARAPLTSRL